MALSYHDVSIFECIISLSQIYHVTMISRCFDGKQGEACKMIFFTLL